MNALPKPNQTSANPRATLFILLEIVLLPAICLWWFYSPSQKTLFDLEVLANQATWHDQYDKYPDYMSCRTPTYLMVDGDNFSVKGGSPATQAAFRQFLAEADTERIKRLTEHTNATAVALALKALAIRDRPLFERHVIPFLVDERPVVVADSCGESTSSLNETLKRWIETGMITDPGGDGTWAGNYAYRERKIHYLLNRNPTEKRALYLSKEGDLQTYESLKKLAKAGDHRAIIKLAAFRRPQDLHFFDTVMADEKHLRTACILPAVFPHPIFRPTLEQLFSKLVGSTQPETELIFLVKAAMHYPDPTVETFFQRLASELPEDHRHPIIREAFVYLTETPELTKRYAETAVTYYRQFGVYSQNFFNYAVEHDPILAADIAQLVIEDGRPWITDVVIWAEKQGNANLLNQALAEVTDPLAFTKLANHAANKRIPQLVTILLKRLDHGEVLCLKFQAITTAFCHDPRYTRQVIKQWLAQNKAHPDHPLIERFCRDHL